MSFSEIAALTIHDVKNRLARLAARAEGKGDTETLRTALEAAATLTQLLAFYKSENGILRPDIEAHAPADLIEELVEEGKGIGTVRLRLEADAAPTLAFYDEALVRMVLANALHNAMRYARQEIVVSCVEQDGQIAFVVRDDGAGYPDSVLADAGDSAPVTRDGTGLGLRLARRVAELHENAGRRGRLLLGNDRGGVFTLRLPK
jgi:signal transduction histidine kinase